MTASQNGWRVIARSECVDLAVPGGVLPVHGGDVAVVLGHVAERYHAEVEALIWPGCWGWADRDVRGMTDISNHASGTAIDLNAPRHPMGTQPSANYSRAQLAAIRSIVDECAGVITWGGDYSGRKDGMHFELSQGISEAAVASLAARIKGGPGPQPTPPAPAPQPTPQPPDDGMLRRGSTGPRVATMQQRLKTRYPVYRHRCGVLVVDGVFGPVTEAWVREFQRRSGLVVDGIAGPRTLGALGLR